MAIINPKNAVLDSDIIMQIVSSDPNANFQYFEQLCFLYQFDNW